MKRNKVLEAIRARGLSIAAIGLSLACLGISLAYRPAPQVVALTARASAVELGTTGQVVFEQSIPVKPGSIIVGSISAVSFNGTPTKVDAVQGLVDAAQTGPVDLTRLMVSPNAAVLLTTNSHGCLELGIRNGLAEVQLTGEAGDIALQIPASKDGRSDIQFCLGEPLELAIYGVSRIGFDRKYQPNPAQSYSMSSLNSATVAFPGLSLERAIIPFGGLSAHRLGSSTPLVVKVSPSSAEIDVAYVGKVHSVTTGPSGNRREELPRLLEHFIGRSPVATMIAGFGFFWGLIWGAIRFSKPASQ